MDLDLKRVGMSGIFATFTFQKVRNGYRGDTRAQARALNSGKERRDA